MQLFTLLPAAVLNPGGSWMISVLLGVVTFAMTAVAAAVFALAAAAMAATSLLGGGGSCNIVAPRGESWV